MSRPFNASMARMVAPSVPAARRRRRSVGSTCDGGTVDAIASASPAAAISRAAMASRSRLSMPVIVTDVTAARPRAVSHTTPADAELRELRDGNLSVFRHVLARIPVDDGIARTGAEPGLP